MMCGFILDIFEGFAIELLQLYEYKDWVHFQQLFSI